MVKIYRISWRSASLVEIITYKNKNSSYKHRKLNRYDIVHEFLLNLLPAMYNISCTLLHTYIHSNGTQLLQCCRQEYVQRNLLYGNIYSLKINFLALVSISEIEIAVVLIRFLHITTTKHTIYIVQSFFFTFFHKGSNILEQ